MDTNINIPKKEIAPGIFSTGGTATMPTINPISNQPNVITPQALQPTTPINLAGTIPTPTVDTSIVANATQNATNFDTQAEYQRQLDLQKQTTPDQTPLNDLLASLTASEQGLTGRGEAQLTAETTAGIPEAQKARATLQGQIKSQLAEYNALKADRDKLLADLEVGTRGTGNADVRTSVLLGQQGAVERQYLARLNSKASDIGLLQAQDQALAGQIETAQNTVNRAIDLKYQDKEAEYQIKKLQYDRIKDTLTAEEKKRGEAMQNALKKEEAILAEAKQTEKDIQNLALKIGSFGADSATIQRVMKANDFNEALTLAGKYLQNPKDSLDMQLTKAQIAKAWADAKKVDTTTGTLTEAQLKQIDTSPQGKKLVSLSGLYQKSQTYKNLLDTYGFQAVGSEKAKLDQAYADLKIAYKEAANLGALTGPDVLLLEEAIKPASGATNYLNYRLSGGKKGVSGAIDGALSKARAEALQNFKQLTARKPEYRGSEYVTSLIAPFAEDYTKVELNNLSAGEIIQTPDGILLEALGNGQFSPL